MYALHFHGWAQCRLATDPDPSNDPRGVSGYTFAVAGEPDLDQVIYLQPGPNIVQRSFCPKIGVKVTSGWEGDGASKRLPKSHPLIGAAVDLLQKPIFDSRNSILINDGFGVINPFIFNLTGKGFDITRKVNFGENGEDVPPDEVPASYLEQNYKWQCFDGGFANLSAESGLLNPVALRALRLKELKRELKNTAKSKEVARAALQKRISELQINDPLNRRTAQMYNRAMFNYPLNGQATANGKKFKTKQDWPCEMWFGAWDADAMAMYVQGAVVLSELPKGLV